jgi:hypothetical protein
MNQWRYHPLTLNRPRNKILVALSCKSSWHVELI